MHRQLCSACGLCARFCPTGALHFEQSDPKFDLGFGASTCIGCDICVVACPENAVVLEELTQVAKFLQGERRSLVNGTMVTCGRCGAPAAVREIDETRILCYACRAAGRFKRRAKAPACW